MKNKAGFYTTSASCAALGGEEAAFCCIKNNDVKIANVNPNFLCEWHHASANRLAFFPKNDSEIKKINDALEKISAAKKAAKDKNLPRSKAAAWRGMSAKDAGFGCIEYKIGKFGPFVPTFGEPDGCLYFPSDEYATAARKFLK